MMELLLEKGAKVNALDNLGQTALHRAAQQGNVQACKLLMAYNIGMIAVHRCKMYCLHMSRRILILLTELFDFTSLVFSASVV